MDRSVTTKLSSEIASAIGFGHTRLPPKHKCFPANYSLAFQPHNFSISNDLRFMVLAISMPFSDNTATGT